MIDYTTLARVKEYIEVDAENESAVGTFITAISREMDRMANRVLVATPLGSGDESDFKFYDGDDTNNLLIDDCFEIETVEIGDQFGEHFVATESYKPYPAIAPHRAIILKGGSFPCGMQNVKVTANFGYLENLPEDLQFACTVLVAGVLKNKEAGGLATSEKIGNYAVTYDTTEGGQDYRRAIDIITSYRKNLF